MSKPRVPALGAEGWFTEDDAGEPALIGQPVHDVRDGVLPGRVVCLPQPRVRRQASSSRSSCPDAGTVWSYTDAQYQPPPPYVPTTDPYEPFAIAAVELPDEGMVVLGQVAGGYGIDDLRVGGEVELVVETLFEDDDNEYRIWRWKPTEGTER